VFRLRLPSAQVLAAVLESDGEDRMRDRPAASLQAGTQKGIDKSVAGPYIGR